MLHTYGCAASRVRQASARIKRAHVLRVRPVHGSAFVEAHPRCAQPRRAPAARSKCLGPAVHLQRPVRCGSRGGLTEVVAGVRKPLATHGVVCHGLLRPNGFGMAMRTQLQRLRLGAHNDKRNSIQMSRGWKAVRSFTNVILLNGRRNHKGWVPLQANVGSRNPRFASGFLRERHPGRQRRGPWMARPVREDGDIHQGIWSSTGKQDATHVRKVRPRRLRTRPSILVPNVHIINAGSATGAHEFENRSLCHGHSESGACRPNRARARVFSLG